LADFHGGRGGNEGGSDDCFGLYQWEECPTEEPIEPVNGVPHDDEVDSFFKLESITRHCCDGSDFELWS